MTIVQTYIMITGNVCPGDLVEEHFGGFLTKKKNDEEDGDKKTKSYQQKMDEIILDSKKRKVFQTYQLNILYPHRQIIEIFLSFSLLPMITISSRGQHIIENVN